MEKGGTKIVQGTTSLVDLTLPSGATAWPFASYSYLVLRSKAFRQTCAIKTAMVIHTVVSTLIPMNGIV
jgi:hypothetical protein